jgi:uncharacterized protein (TIGR02147 family)
MKSIYEFENYKNYLKNFEESQGTFIKGFRSKLAAEMSCQSGYVTHVLNGHAHFSLEQAYRIRSFLGQSEAESKYFLQMVHLARAGTNELKNLMHVELLQLKETQQNLKNRVGESKALTEKDQAVYYSSWIYSAIHVLVSLPGFNDIKKISESLRLTEDVVKYAAQFLVRAGILIEHSGRIKPGQTQVHLQKQSDFITQHHQNGRLAAIQSLTDRRKFNLHYSTMSSLSKADAESLKMEMLAMIQNYVEKVRPSKEEIAVAFNLDFFLISG